MATDPRVHATETLQRAVTALDHRAPRAFDDATVELATCCADPTVAAPTVATLDRSLQVMLADVWQRGWQPADLHRVALRRNDSQVATFTTHVIAAQLSVCPVGTVHSRFREQLDGLLEGGQPDLTSALGSFRSASGLSWVETIDAAARTAHLLLRVPEIELLLPVPGQQVITSANDPDALSLADTTRVDERVLVTVRRLLAKAEGTTFEAEAETFTVAAQKLMSRHRISEAMLAASHAREHGARTLAPGARRIGVDAPYESSKVQLLGAVAHANGCQTVWTKELGFVTVVGFASDTAGVELMFTSLLVQAVHAMTAAGGRTDAYGRSRTKSFRSSFLTAYAHRIAERLDEARQAEVDAAVSASADGSGSAGAGSPAAGFAAEGAGTPAGALDGGRAASSAGAHLLPALAARDEQVQQHVRELFPRLVKARSRATMDAEGWHSGRAAADRARLSSAGPLTGATARS